MIPTKLRREDLLFLPIPRGEKGPITPGWNLVKNGMRWDDPQLVVHLERGGNYGMYPGPESDILMLDIDDADKFYDAGGLDLVGETYRYSAWEDRHKYRAVVTCQDIPEIWRGHKSPLDALEIYYPAGTVKGDIKSGGQCVSPGSLHPNGNRYEIFDTEADILPVFWGDVLRVCERLKPKYMERKIPEIGIYREPQRGYKNLIRIRYGLMLEMPDNPRPSGNEIRGASPFHGSETGNNVAVNPQKGVFYCFRHRVGYDAAGIDAIRRGIIQCGDPYTEDVFKIHISQLETDYPEIRLAEIAEYKKRQKKTSPFEKYRRIINKVEGGSK